MADDDHTSEPPIGVPSDLRAILQDHLQDDEEILLADGLESAFIGLLTVFGRDRIAVYDWEKSVQATMASSDMTHEEATEFLEFNTLGAYVGPLTPGFLESIDLDLTRHAIVGAGPGPTPAHISRSSDDRARARLPPGGPPPRREAWRGTDPQGDRPPGRGQPQAPDRPPGLRPVEGEMTIRRNRNPILHSILILREAATHIARPVPVPATTRTCPRCQRVLGHDDRTLPQGKYHLRVCMDCVR